MTDRKVLNLIVPAKAEYLSLVRLVVSAAAQNLGFEEDSIADIKVALSEASTNVVRHAYFENTDRQERTIEISCFDGQGDFKVEVLDRGHGMPLPPPPSEGLGFGIMGSLMDKVDVETSDCGTAVLLVKYAGAGRERTPQA
ncbi:MAG: ATP-binding protein [Thermoleophilia bacterium]